MCWKQEWAMAIGNLNHAIEHVNKAKLKLEKRADGNKATIEKLKGNVRRSDIRKQAEANLLKNLQGVEECQSIIYMLKTKRHELQKMIETYGFSRKDNPERTKRLMGKCVLCRSADEAKHQTCVTAPFCGQK